MLLKSKKKIEGNHASFEDNYNQQYLYLYIFKIQAMIGVVFQIEA